MRYYQALLVALLRVRALVDANAVVGCNAGSPGGRAMFFADLMKQATFGNSTSPGSQNIELDTKGWPAVADFTLLLYSESGGGTWYDYPKPDLSGIYTITAEGCATVSVPNDFGNPAASVLNQSCAGGALLAYLSIAPAGSGSIGLGGKLALAFSHSTRANDYEGAGLEAISILQPGYPIGTDPDTFTAAAIALFKRCSLIRYLDWTYYGHAAGVSSTPPTSDDWSKRAHVGDPSYPIPGWGVQGAGIPWELAAKLANSAQADMWANIPSSANETRRDEYVTNLIQLLDKLLPPGRKIYLEFANECMFSNNACWVSDRLLANTSILQHGDPYRINMGLPPPNASDEDTQNNHWTPRFYAYTCMRIAQVAAGVVGRARVGRADDPGEHCSRIDSVNRLCLAST